MGPEKGLRGIAEGLGQEDLLLRSLKEVPESLLQLEQFFVLLLYSVRQLEQKTFPQQVICMGSLAGNRQIRQRRSSGGSSM